MGEVFVIKGIKPARLRVKEIRQEILNELRKEGTDQRRELNKTVSTWEGEKPKFESLIGLERPPDGYASVLTGPNGSEHAINKWRWLDEGTRKNYPITARRVSRLAFRWPGFKAKTTVGKFTSGRGSKATGPLRWPITVIHPGIEARGWSKLLTERRRRPFTQRMIAAMQRGAAKAFK